MLSPSSRRTSQDSLDFPTSPLPNRTASPIQRHERTFTPLSGRRSPSRRPSVASSITSIGGTLDTISQGRIGSVSESSQNAISTLLQPPIVRTGMLPHTHAPASTHKAPTAKDIPPVTLANVPNVDTNAFKSYLSQVGSLWNTFQEAKEEAEKESAEQSKQDASNQEGSADVLEKRLYREQASGASHRQESSSASSPARGPAPVRRRSSGTLAARRRNEVTPLSTIPQIYFDEEFRLENPRTFDIVSERSEVVRQTPTPGEQGKEANGQLNGATQGPRKALATNAILQEKLSWYMDTVEVHLISSISTASTSFFAALGSLRDLQSEAAESVQRIKTIRRDLANLDKEMAIGGLDVIKMKRRRQNLRRLRDATEQLNSVIQGVTHCEELIDRGEFVLALDRLDIVEKLVMGSPALDGSVDLSWLDCYVPTTLLDLRELKALDGLPDAMQQLRFRVGKGFEARFLETLLGDLRTHVKAVNSKDTLQRWGAAFHRGRGDHQRSPSVFPAYMKERPNLRADLKVALLGLHRSRYTQQAAASFRESVMKEMKALIRQHLPSSTDDDNESVMSGSTRASSRALSQQDKSSILARNLRALDPLTAEDLFVGVYTNVSEALRRLSIQVKVLLDVTSGTASPPMSSPMNSPPLSGARSPGRTPTLSNIDDFLSSGKTTPITNGQLQEELIQALDMSSLLGQAVDIAQTQITKILKVRSEQTIRLPYVRFLRYFNLNRLFADECEAVSGRSGTSLKGVVNGQIKDFLTLFGDSEKSQLANIMNADRWEAKDFGPTDQAILDRIIQSMESDPQSWQRTPLIWEEYSESSSEATNGATPDDATTNGTSTAKEKEKSRLATIDDQNIILVTSVLACLRGIERTCTLLTCLPGLTTETANLLLEYLKIFNSRSCQLILGAGAVHSAGLKNINTKSLALASQALTFVIALIPYMREFVRRHSSSSPAIAKFDEVKRLYHDHQGSIHDKLIDIMCSRATARVSTMSKIDWDTDTAEGASPHMETLTKETAVLHRVLSKHLPEATVRGIMLPVFASYREVWGQGFREARVGTGRGKQRLLRDAELFDSKLSKIDGAGDIGSYIVGIVRAKTVADEKQDDASEATAADDTATEKKSEEKTKDEDDKS